MQKFLNRFDEFAGIDGENAFAKWLERIAFFFLILMILAEPHSIAATQTAWLLGLTAWVGRLFVKPRRKFLKTPLNIALWTFFGWSLVTAIFSYAPDISLDRLRGTAVFLIFFFVTNNLRTKRAAVFLACALIFSAMVPVVWTPVERLLGRGVEVKNLAADNPFSKGRQLEGTPLRDGDTIFAVGKKSVRSPEVLLAEIEKNETSEVRYYRPDYDSLVEINRAELLDGGANALEKLGIGEWKHSHNWRSAGTYGHYTTFAEVLQLVGSLILGLLISALFYDSRNSGFKTQFSNFKNNLLTKRSLLLFFCLAATSLALLLTVTRASQLGFLASAFAVVFVGINRKFLLILAAIILPLALVGVYFQQQSRQVGYFDSNDDSSKDRLTFYRKGFYLWTDNAKNFSLGVGMDATKRFIKEWNLYDNQGQPMGHFHSTPLQLLVERGFPAFLLWLWILYVYGRTLLRGIQNSRFKIQNSKPEIQDTEIADRRPQTANHSSDWKSYGIILGCFGGMTGFFTGGLVHYNLGDAEVAMCFYILMGISIYLALPNSQPVEIRN